MAFYRYWAIILPTFRSLRRPLGREPQTQAPTMQRYAQILGRGLMVGANYPLYGPFEEQLSKPGDQ